MSEYAYGFVEAARAVVEAGKDYEFAAELLTYTAGLVKEIEEERDQLFRENALLREQWGFVSAHIEGPPLSCEIVADSHG